MVEKPNVEDGCGCMNDEGIVKGAGPEVRTNPHTKGQAIMMDINQHGEVHMIVDEHGDVEIEARKGQTKYNSNINVLIIFDGDVHQKIDADSVVRWYTPVGVMH